MGTARYSEFRSASLAVNRTQGKVERRIELRSVGCLTVRGARVGGSWRGRHAFEGVVVARMLWGCGCGEYVGVGVMRAYSLCL